jgi:hypothetical protein
MTEEEARRCSDCFSEFTADARRFVVFKAEEPIWDSEYERWWPMGREEVVCADCVGWYGEASCELERW